MHHQIKINKAQRLAPKLPKASAEIWRSIPAKLHSQLTSKQLALVVEVLDSHWHKAANHTTNEIIAEGYVWSNKHQALLDITYPQH